MNSRFSPLLAASWLAAVSVCPAASVTLQPVADTGLFENRPNNNLGAMVFMPVGSTSQFPPMQTRGLIRFDTSGIPSGAQITSASLRITVTLSPSAASPIFDLHRMLVTWNEGNKSGGPFAGTGNMGAAASAGEATWNHRAAPSTSWGTPGGSGGTDFVTTASASQPVSPSGSSTFTSATLAADVQGWVNEPNSNFGWLLKVQNEAPGGTARRVASREAGVSAPQLTVQFVVPPRIEGVGVAGGEFQFSFRAAPGSLYEVQRRPQLSSGNWTTFTNVPSQTVETDIVIVDPIGPGDQFYQVIIP